MPDISAITNNYILYFLLPLWILPGLADWWCHRRTNIEATSGIKEAVLHLVMITSLGVPIMLGLLLEVNALVLLLMILAFFAHQAMAVWDVNYATTKRAVTPMEQHVHSYLVALPFMTVSFVICLYWNQFLALLGQGPETADLTLRWKDPPLPANYLATIIGSVTLFLTLPYFEETWRCYRSIRARSVSEGEQ